MVVTGDGGPRLRIRYHWRMVAELQLDLPMAKIADFCKRWRVRELAVFGSILREDFGPDSDIDVLVTFEDDAAIGLPALVRMHNELAEITGRKVDVIPRDAVVESDNRRRRERILGSAQVVYAA